MLLAYVLSFVYLGIYWNNHHHMLQATHRVTGAILWANLHLLFWLSLVPFTTGVDGRERTCRRVPTAAYGIVLLAAAIAYYVLQAAIIRARARLAARRGHRPRLQGQALPADVLPRASGSSFVQPGWRSRVYVVVALMWLVPDRRVERRMSALDGGPGVTR